MCGQMIPAPPKSASLLYPSKPCLSSKKSTFFGNTFAGGVWFEILEECGVVLSGGRGVYDPGIYVARIQSLEYVPAGRTVFSAFGAIGEVGAPAVEQGDPGGRNDHSAGIGDGTSGEPGFYGLGLPDYAL